MTFSWLKSERFWRLAVGSLFFLGFSGGVFIGSLLIYPPASGSFKFQKDSKTVLQEPPKYDAVAAGALSLAETGASRFLPVIINELTLLGANTRPGSGDESKLHLLLDKTKEERIIGQGQSFFLKLEESEAGQLKLVGFSSEEKGVKVTPVTVHDGGARLQINVLGEHGEERGEVSLEEKGGGLSATPYLGQLKESKWWGVDALIRHYGGEELNEKKGRQKIELGGSAGHICYIGAGDYLIWDQGRWKECTQEELTEKKPLAHVKVVAGHVMEIKVWDETGFLSENVRLTPQTISKRPLNLDSLPASIRMRSDSGISCLLGKRRLLLREGDWILHTAQGWRLLKKASDIDDYLNHRLFGELFIFDKLSKESGKVILEGHTFDAMRTQMQKISIPVSTEKRSPKAKPLRRAKRI